MSRLLILFAHPLLEKSRVHNRLLLEAQKVSGVTLHDLYEVYPEFDINVPFEQALLQQHDIIALQHPFYWYSAPAIIKQWLDLVLQHGWAYGSGGTKLAGKKACNFISFGGPLSSYSSAGHNQYSIQQFLAPFERTAVLCHMQYLPPFVVPGSHRLTDAGIESFAAQYRDVLQMLTSSDHTKSMLTTAYLNDLVAPTANP
jgi:glutathione-regulated potassium-efflux system ancillary protein KefG